jgi:hypothetical protein
MVQRSCQPLQQEHRLARPGAPDEPEIALVVDPSHWHETTSVVITLERVDDVAKDEPRFPNRE